MEDLKDRDEEIIGFISTLIGSIPIRKLSDEDCMLYVAMARTVALSRNISARG